MSAFNARGGLTIVTAPVTDLVLNTVATKSGEYSTGFVTCVRIVSSGATSATCEEAVIKAPQEMQQPCVAEVSFPQNGQIIKRWGPRSWCTNKSDSQIASDSTVWDDARESTSQNVDRTVPN
jgi:hypothetical protein